MKFAQGKNYMYGYDIGEDGGTAYCVYKKPSWFERHILRVKWRFKLVHSEYEPDERSKG